MEKKHRTAGGLEPGSVNTQFIKDPHLMQVMGMILELVGSGCPVAVLAIRSGEEMPEGGPDMARLGVKTMLVNMTPDMLGAILPGVLDSIVIAKAEFLMKEAMKGDETEED